VSRSRPEVVGIGVSATRHTLAVCARNGQWRVHSSAATALWPSVLARSLESLLAGIDGSRLSLNVVLAPDSCREWVMDAPSGVHSLEELRRVTAARFTQLHGLAPDDWTITADWQTRGPMLCAATPTALLDTLQSALANHASRINVSTTLCSVLADIRALPDDTWLCIRTPDFLRLLFMRHRRPWILRTLAVATPEPLQQLSLLLAEVKRSTLRSGLAPAARIFLYDCISQPIGTTTHDGIQITPLDTPALRHLDLVPRDSDSAIAACMGAVS
jgi:hypothetical protein